MRDYSCVLSLSIVQMLSGRDFALAVLWYRNSISLLKDGHIKMSILGTKPNKSMHSPSAFLIINHVYVFGLASSTEGCVSPLIAYRECFSFL